ncbi:MAG TPA: metallophosphoesterase [Candidatus Hydrogenedentes bacterium]|nr:metallophosphoesterase [Candidatus Hydrogenedentota bacterium]
MPLFSARRITVIVLGVLFVASAAFPQQSPRPQQYPLLEGQWPASDGGKFSFVILGDKTSGGEGQWPVFDRAVEAINLLEPDFVITVGDHIPGHMQERAQWEAEWAEYLEHARRLDAPQYLTPGNHDIANTECYGFWKEDFGRTYYAFDYKGCHFLVLNTEEERFDGRGPVWNAMMTFAEQDLGAHSQSRHTFIFFHKPMWDDPRYENDMKRLEQALGSRPYTIIAGHEHYLMSERRNGRLYVIQSATGGGIDVSGVPEFGAFHAFGCVTVDGNDVTYAVVQPAGPVLPVDTAPAWFRKAVARNVLTWDALEPPVRDGDTVLVRTVARFANPFEKSISISATVSSLDEFMWEPVLENNARWRLDGGNLVTEVPLEPTKDAALEITFRTVREHLSYPPRYAFRVRYGEGWLNGESYPMEQENVIPAYPAETLRSVPEWQVIGPFPLGDIDTSKLPGDPAAANPNFFREFGPERGYDPDREYPGGLRWQKVASQGRGLLNFNALLGTQDLALAYALCGVYSPRAQATHLVMYSDNFSYAMLNGEIIHEGQDFGAPGGFTYVPLNLREGWNTLIVKLINNRGDWFLRVLAADPAKNLNFGDTILNSMDGGTGITGNMPRKQ